jgi:hypothetical protein
VTDLEVRITKYNPKSRNAQGAYVIDDWTSVSDIGRFEGFTQEKYINWEKKYWEIVSSSLHSIEILNLRICDLETGLLADSCSSENDLIRESAEYCSSKNLKSGILVGICDFKKLFEAALREVIWFRAIGDFNTFVHFGYDYYLYFGSEKEFCWSNVDGMFVELFSSPYHKGC